jgi:hypothetical protein
MTWCISHLAERIAMILSCIIVVSNVELWFGGAGEIGLPLHLAQRPWTATTYRMFTQCSKICVWFVKALLLQGHDHAIATNARAPSPVSRHAPCGGAKEHQLQATIVGHGLL